MAIPLSHTSSIVFDQLGKRAQTAEYQWQRRTARIAQCFYCCCCDAHGIGKFGNPSCWTICKARTVKYTSSCLSLSLTTVCTISTCGMFFYCCECSEPPRQRMEARVVDVLPQAK